MTAKTGELIDGCCVDDGDQIMLITNQGIVMRMSVDDISTIGRNTSGVKLMNVSQDEDIKVIGMARIWSGFLSDESSDEGEGGSKDGDEADEAEEPEGFKVSEGSEESIESDTGMSSEDSGDFEGSEDIE